MVYSEFHPLCHGATVLVAKMAIGYQGKGAIILVPKPVCNRGNRHAGLDTLGGKAVAEVVMRNFSNPNRVARARKGLIALADLNDSAFGQFPKILLHAF